MVNIVPGGSAAWRRLVSIAQLATWAAVAANSQPVLNKNQFVDLALYYFTIFVVVKAADVESNIPILLVLTFS